MNTPARNSAVFLDIDGTLNVRGCEIGSTLIRRGGEEITRDAGGVFHLDVGLFYNAVRETRDWLNELHSVGVQLIWSTTWNDQADDFAEWFGLPTGLPFLRQDANREAFGRSLKVATVTRFLDQHPELERAVILDDVIGTYDFDDARNSGGRLLIPELDEDFGVTTTVRAEVDAFLGGSRP